MVTGVSSPPHMATLNSWARVLNAVNHVAGGKIRVGVGVSGVPEHYGGRTVPSMSGAPDNMGFALSQCPALPSCTS